MEKLTAAQAKRKARALQLWDASMPLAGTIGENYLASRCLAGLVNSPALRFHGEVSHPAGGKFPAMVALVVDVAGMPIGVHRTYLASDGLGKAAVEPPKASLGQSSGGIIRLAQLNMHAPVVVGEGIETSASAGILTKAPASAAICAGNLERSLVLPSEVTEVIIAVDPDPPGWKAARGAAQRWTNEGRHVQFACPSGSGDFNELLCAKTKDASHG